MKRKRMIKLLMSHGIQRNDAVHYANHCGADLPLNMMGAIVCAYPHVRMLLRALPAAHNLHIQLGQSDE